MERLGMCSRILRVDEGSDPSLSFTSIPLSLLRSIGHAPCLLVWVWDLFSLPELKTLNFLGISW